MKKTKKEVERLERQELREKGKKVFKIPLIFAFLVSFIFISFIWLDKIKIPRSQFLDSLLAPLAGAYSYISLALLIFLAGVFFNRIYKSNLKKEASALVIAVLLGFLL
ncbi:MAG: hypothetical protein QXE64_02645, partial [Candidatus Pacearchaeota archaeon]